MRFVGTIEAKVDAKGRLFCPAVFRKVLQSFGEKELVLAKDAFQSCLVLYPMSVWDERVDALRAKLNLWDAKHQMVFRQFVSDVEVVCLDSTGRLLVSKRYIHLAAIEQEVTFVGMDNTIEIWAKREKEVSFMDADRFASELQHLMSEDHER
ncbi:MAG: division/cell wall cluster transcriptional repressor MraZ [Bacteroidaceae bacterium]